MLPTPVGLACVFAGSQLGLLDDRSLGFGVRQHRYRHQYHRDDYFDALPRHEAESYAAAGMDELGDVWNGSARDFASIRSSNHVARGSLSWRSFFRYAISRFSHLVDALLLDIWASRGVCTDHSLFCVC